MKKLIYLFIVSLLITGCTASYNVTELPPVMKDKGKTEDVVEKYGFLALRKTMSIADRFNEIEKRQGLYKLYYVGEHWIIYEEL